VITKEHLLERIIKECNICTRLYTKLPEGSLDYRPTQGQRSTLELLRYLSVAIAGSAHAIVEGHWDWYKKEKEKADKMPADEFPKAMARQIDEVKDFFATQLTPDVFEHQKVVGMPWPTEKVVGLELMENCLLWAVGYRMQLYLYAKACGASSLNTYDCWFATEDSKANENLEAEA